MQCRRSLAGAGVGQPCEISSVDGADDCGSGSICLPDARLMGEIRVGRCVAYCDGDAQAPACRGAGQRSAITMSGQLPLCLPACDPLVGDCVTAGELCIVVGQPQVAVCVPASPGTSKAQGEACACANCCASGLGCVDAGRVPGLHCAQRPCCARYCIAGVEGQCAQGEACRALGATSDPLTRSVGVCALR